MNDGARGDTLRNLKTARCQIDGIVRMIESERYCLDVSKQNLSAASLLKKANFEVLRGHVKTCVIDAILNDEPEE